MENENKKERTETMLIRKTIIMAVQCQINKIKRQTEKYSQTVIQESVSNVSSSMAARRGAHEQRKQRRDDDAMYESLAQRDGNVP